VKSFRVCLTVCGPGFEQVSAGTSFMNFREMGYGVTGSVQFNVTPLTSSSLRFNVNSKGSGTINLHVSSHDHLELAYLILVPTLAALWAKFRGEQY
jgi:hypothetical protein